MPVQRFTLAWDKLNDGVEVIGDAGLNIAREIAKQAKTVACSVYREAPGAIIPNPAANAISAMWDYICKDPAQSDEGLPPVPAPPFSGGQCPVSYIVRYKYYYNADGTNVSGVFNSSSFPGVISGIRIRLYGSGKDDIIPYPGGLQNSLYDNNSITILYPDGTEYIAVSSVANTYGLEIVELKRVDGLPDDCGDLPPEFPPTPPDYVPPSGDFPITPRDNNPDYSINIPFVWVDASPEFNFKPYIDVGGIKITFDLGGINFEFDSDNPPVPLPDSNPSPDIILPPPIQIDFGDIVTNVNNNTTNEADRIITNNNNNTTNINNNTTNEGDRIINNDNNNTTNINNKIEQACDESEPVTTGNKQFLRVVADASNYVGKTLFSDNNSDVVIFGGYVRWTIDGIPYGSEEAIRRLEQHFAFPDWANGYVLIPQNSILLTAAIIEKVVTLPQVRFILPADPVA